MTTGDSLGDPDIPEEKLGPPSLRAITPTVVEGPSIVDTGKTSVLQQECFRDKKWQPSESRLSTAASETFCHTGTEFPIRVDRTSLLSGDGKSLWISSASFWWECRCPGYYRECVRQYGGFALTNYSHGNINSPATSRDETRSPPHNLRNVMVYSSMLRAVETLSTTRLVPRMHVYIIAHAKVAGMSYRRTT